MAPPPLPVSERQARKSLVEALLKEGFAPPGIRGEGARSSLEEACKRVGRPTGYFTKWLYSEEGYRTRGEPHFIPNWALWTPFPAAVPAAAEVLAEPVEVVAPAEHAEARANDLWDEIRGLLTKSRYPVVNPDAVLVDSHMVRKYSRKSQTYEDRESAPRTWLSDTLKVEAIPDARGRKFLFTGAQNDAPIHLGFWANLEAFAAYLGAEIVVGPWTYETQWWSENNPTSRVYDTELSEFLCFGQMRIGDNFVFCGEMNTLPTASAPISDLVTYSRGRWAVFPHAKRQLKSVPSTDPNSQAHQVMTTGAVTLPKVIARKAGVKSIFHHVIGATLVEFDQDGDLFCRQITADEDGSFYDLDRFVQNGQVTTGHRAKALVVGDLHLRKLDQGNAMATFGFDLFGGLGAYQNSIIELLDPENVCFHDVFDNETRNHHHSGDNAYSYEMAIRGRDSVGDEIREVANFLAKFKDQERNIIVVESNHDIGLERYVREGRYRNDGSNVRLGLMLEGAYLDYRAKTGLAIDNGEKAHSFSLLEHAVRIVDQDLDNCEWVHDGNSRLIDGVEVGHHGFRGANGSKGTIAGFARIGRKMTIGDKHSPEIMDGVYCVGTMNLRHGYNKGPSGWAVTHCIQYPNGKRTLVTLQAGKWRAERPRVRMPANKAA